MELQGIHRILQRPQTLPPCIIISRKVTANAYALFVGIDKMLSFKDFIAIYALYHSSLKDIKEFLFLLFDIRQDKFITRDESLILAQCYIGVKNKKSKSAKDAKEEQEIVNSLHRGSDKIDLETFAANIGTIIDIPLLIEPFEIIPRARKEESIIKESISSHPLERSECQYLISSKWWRQWEIYVLYSQQAREDNDYYKNCFHNIVLQSLQKENIDDSIETQKISVSIMQSKLLEIGNSLNLGNRPGPIDSSDLYESSNSDKLKTDLMYKLNYMLVPIETWELLVGWYGSNSIPIKCNVIIKAGKPIIDLYPPKVYISVCKFLISNS